MNRSHDRAIARLAIPALGALAADPLTSLVDTAFVGRLGTRPLAALGVDAAIFGLAFFAFNFLAYGVTPLVSAALGKERETEARELVGTALVLALGLGIAVTAVLELAAIPILDLMGASGELGEEAGGYLRIRALAAPAVLIVTVGHGAFRGFHDTRTPLYVTLGLNLVNLVLDPIFIFGLDWGLEGAAAATAIAQWTGAFVFLLLIRARLGVTVGATRPSRSGDLLKVGGDNFVRTLALLIAFTMTTRVATAVGEEQVAAHQVALQILFLLALIIDGLAIAAQALVSRYLGADRAVTARDVSDRLLVLGLGLGIILCLLLLASRGLVPGIFTDSGEVEAQLSRIWWLLAAIQVPAALVYVWDGIVMGAVDFRYLAKAMILSSLAALIVLALVVPLDWGLEGVWWAILLLNLVRLATLARWYFRPRSVLARV